MIPTEGRIVHYFTTDPKDQEAKHAALIVAVHSPECVNLRVFGRHGDSDWGVTSAVFSETPKQGHWSWPTKN